MVTVIIDNWTIVSIIIPLLIIAVVGLTILMLNYRNELQWTTRAYEATEKYYKEYRNKYFSMEQKYNQLQKQIKRDEEVQ